MQDATQKRLRYFIERVETLREDQRALGGDIKDLLGEAKSEGFDAKIMRKILALRQKSKVEREEEEALISTYMQALGMEGTPLGDWAEKEKAPA